MEISATEIDLLCRRISFPTTDYVVSSVYSIEKGCLIRLHHSTKPEKLIAVASFAPWITTKNLTLGEATSFISDLREVIERDRLVSVERSGSERIAKFGFRGRDGEGHNLYAEFFAGGNQILTDEDDNIITVANPQRFRHRTLLPGEKYLLPPSRGIPLEQVTASALELIKKESLRGSKPNEQSITAVRWFGRNIGTSRKFVEEVFFRAKVDPKLPVHGLTEEMIFSLARSCSTLLGDLELSDCGYLLVPDEEAISSVGENQRELEEVDVCPIVPHTWKTLANAKAAKIHQFPSFSDALDEAQVQSIVLGKRKKASKEARAKAGELDSAIRKQESLIEKNIATSRELRKIGKEVMTAFESNISNELIQELVSLEVIKTDEASGGRLRFSNEPRAFIGSFNSRGLASRLFDEAKRLEDNNRRIETVKSELIHQKEGLDEQSNLQEDKAERKLVVDRRPREWYERYRWFTSSDGRLAIGGRDSTSNSVIINKYVDPRDFVFHADLHGSPFFVLKNFQEDEQKQEEAPSDEIALEIGTATVSFSRAWKDELGSAEAYWVYPSQVKKSAPSGEYLPRGSFFIEGKKNYLKHLKVALSVGLMTTDRLPGEKDVPKEKMSHDDLSHVEEEKDSLELGIETPPTSKKPDQVLVICGPEKSLSSYCIAVVKIAPGKEKGSSFARKIKQSLVGKVKDQTLREVSKRLAIDDVVRVLPSGSYKLVQEKQNR